MERLLVVRLGSMGDIVHALPAVASLRAAYPAARLDWVVEARWRELIELNPDVTRVLTVDTRAWRRRWSSPATWRRLFGFIGSLRRARYDAALDSQGLYKSAVVARLSGAPRRYGFDRQATKEAGAARFYTHKVVPPAGSHVVEMNLALAEAAGAARGPVRFPLPTTPEDESWAEEFLRKHHLGEFVILSPGGGWGSKCWPVARYAMLHNVYSRLRGWRTFLNAGPGEDALVREFFSQARVSQPVHAPLHLQQLVALVRRARVLVSGDTGPLHVAAAVGTPVVGLYGPTDPRRNGPYASARARAEVIHHNDKAVITYKHEEEPSPAMLAITVEEVLAAMNRVTGTGNG